MKLSVFAFGALALAGILSGCISAEVTKSNGRETIVVENNVCKLFCCLPIASGDPNYPNREVASWFENTVTLETNMRMVDETIEREGARGFKCLASSRTEEQIVPFILKRCTLYTSAEIVR